MNVPVTVWNNASVAAASMKFLVSDPDRKTTLAEPVVSVDIAPDQMATQTVTVTVPMYAALGIYRIDYLLLDASGNEIQPRSETDSGRFVVSQPAANPYTGSGLFLAVNTASETIFPNQPVTVTATFTNTTGADQRLRLYWEWDHQRATRLEDVTVPPAGLMQTSTVPGLTYSGGHRFWLHVFSEQGLKLSSTIFYSIPDQSPWPYAGSFGKGFVVQDASVAVVASVPRRSTRRAIRCR